MPSSSSKVAFGDGTWVSLKQVLAEFLVQIDMACVNPVMIPNCSKNNTLAIQDCGYAINYPHEAHMQVRGAEAIRWGVAIRKISKKKNGYRCVAK